MQLIENIGNCKELFFQEAQLHSEEVVKRLIIYIKHGGLKGKQHWNCTK